MAEVNSQQSALIAAGQKLKHCDHGKIEALVITTPATFAQLAISDTMASGQFIPKGSRILSVWEGHGTGTASSTMDIGLRKRDGTVVDADGLTAVAAITAATTIDLNVSTGALLAVGVDYVTLDDVEVYLTAKGAVLAANQDLRITVYYIGP
jgi:hypothetical protein